MGEETQIAARRTVGSELRKRADRKVLEPELGGELAHRLSDGRNAAVRDERRSKRIVLREAADDTTAVIEQVDVRVER